MLVDKIVIKNIYLDKHFGNRFCKICINVATITSLLSNINQNHILHFVQIIIIRSWSNDDWGKSHKVMKHLRIHYSVKNPSSKLHELIIKKKRKATHLWDRVCIYKVLSSNNYIRMNAKAVDHVILNILRCLWVPST